MFEARKRYRTELTEAEKEIPSFDVTRHERCLTCGTLGVDRFVCKSELKIWTGDITKREKIGLVFLKHKDDAGNFVGNTFCETANFMQTVQDDSKFIVRTKNIAFYLCSTESSDSTHTKFDFTDPKYCSPCDKFDPENDELVKGEDVDILSESSQLTGFADDDEKDKEKGKEGTKENQGTKETIEEKHETVKKTVMTRQTKLNLLKDTFHDWLE